MSKLSKQIINLEKVLEQAKFLIVACPEAYLLKKNDIFVADNFTNIVDDFEFILKEDKWYLTSQIFITRFKKFFDEKNQEFVKVYCLPHLHYVGSVDPNDSELNINNLSMNKIINNNETFTLDKIVGALIQQAYKFYFESNKNAKPLKIKLNSKFKEKEYKEIVNKYSLLF